MDWEQAALFIFVINAILVFSGMTALWVVNVLTKNMSYVDVGWSFWIFWTAFTAFLFSNGLPERQLMMLFLIGLWSFRLTGYLIGRIKRKKAEDPRYAAMRDKWGSSELKILAMFLFQGVLILILSLPFLSIAFNQEPLSILDILGFSVGIVGILGETIADWQLHRFTQKNRGKVCREGFWSRSRHPNFFFEWVFWIGIALFALKAPFGLTGIAACALMVILFFGISIPATEKELVKSKNGPYIQYQKEIPGFFPCLKK